MARQLTVRGVDDEVAERLERLARARKKSVNAIVLGILEDAVDAKGRRRRLERYATWSEADLAEFDESLRDQRRIDDELWK